MIILYILLKFNEEIIRLAKNGNNTASVKVLNTMEKFITEAFRDIIVVAQIDQIEDLIFMIGIEIIAVVDTFILTNINISLYI